MGRLGEFSFASKCISDHDLDTFFETGCFRGDSLEDASNLGLKNLYSCDINREYVEKCKKRVPRAKIYHGQSHIVMADVLKTIGSFKCLFWLDAHLPQYHDMKVPKVGTYPLIHEINSIKKNKPNYENDVIMCDDIRMITLNNPYAFTAVDQPADQLCRDVNYNDILGLFSETHDIAEYQEFGHGLLVFSPKKK